MKLLRKIVVVVLLLPIALIVVSFFLPSKYHVERSEIIKAPSEAIYPWLAQLRKWPEWTVWNPSYDPSLAYTYSGPAEGTGSEMAWTAKSGNGSLKLTAADIKTGVKYDLDFSNGKFVSSGAVSMAPAEGGTQVTFSNEGKFGLNPVRRYFGLFFDKMMGGDFQKNLRGLKEKVEPKAN